MRVLIITNGDPPTAETARILAARHDLIMAVDGAIFAAADLGLIAEILTGDFDSVRLDAVRSEYPNLQVVSTPDQDQSDLEKAVGVACDLGADAITVIGAGGGRMDHTLANVSLLLRARIPISLADDFGTVQAIGSDGKADAGALLETSAGDTVSLITFEMGTRVTITDAQWPLNRFHLLPGTRGVSNVALGSSVAVTVHRGSVFICHLYEAAMKLHSEIRTPSME